MLEVAYESQVHWYTKPDLLRTQPDFHGQTRFDSIMVDTVDGPAFAQLVFMFCVTPSNEVGRTQLALICYYTPIPQSSCPHSDKLVGFRRFKLSEVFSAIISLESVIRGVFMVPTFSESGSPITFFVNDLVDSDMFIRMKRYTAL